MQIDGENIYLRFLKVSDGQAMLELNLRNREFFEKYVSTRGDGFYTLKAQKDLLESYERLRRGGFEYSFGIFDKSTDVLIGKISLTEVLRGSLQSCYIGYYLDKDYNGRGHMTEAVRLVVNFAFNELGLHRVEAGVMPRNVRSMRVLEKVGFQKEGISRKNVLINGKWEDHQVLAIIAEDR